MQTICFCNLKGGTGKTTISTNFSYALAKNGAKILFIDNDQQGNATSFFNPGINNITIRTMSRFYFDGASLGSCVLPTKYDNIDMIASDMSLSRYELTEDFSDTRLKEALLTEDFSNYDFCIIDNAPATHLLCRNGLIAADYAVIVAKPDRYSLDGVNNIKLLIEEVIKSYNPALKTKVLLNQYCYASAPGIVKAFRNSTQFDVFNTYISSQPRNLNTSPCFFEQNKSIYECSPGCTFARDLNHFISEFFSREA